MVIAQNWIDTAYQTTSSYDVEYGRSTDFKGAEDILDMDISLPTNDLPPECGRPLMVVVHGGAWYGGDKAEGYAPRLREDFAKRGYVTASVNYRQGMFNTDQNVDCILEGWKCWNMTDTSEWYRANYRAMQDVWGAIRFLVAERETYNLNPDNIFLVGESAGGFIVLGVGYTDNESEILDKLVAEYPDASTPNVIYEADCIQKFSLANSLDDINLSRPELGDIFGELNPSINDTFRIRGVGSFYGGVFNDIFETHTANSPALYLFHQPCDLIVPINNNKLLAGYNLCATGFPTFCQNIINRPFVHGSGSIVNLIDELSMNGTATCEYLFDNSGNNYSCLEQVVNPSLGCHAMDSYGQRTANMSAFFAEKIGECTVSDLPVHTDSQECIAIYPNPVEQTLNINIHFTYSYAQIRVVDLAGKELINEQLHHLDEYALDLSHLRQGIYQVMIEFSDQAIIKKIVKI